MADEIVVDVMFTACGLTYADAQGQTQTARFGDVSVPMATPELLLRLKQTHREKDQLDAAFLQRLIASKKKR
ncbi:MAG TPA: hypothetical protein VEH27_15570 [Methylomirabilota bacterium]|nr:hypothetical protein [Methylomirabilota bacterium]